MKKSIVINRKNATIEITKSFEKKASIYGTDEYRELNEVRKDYLNYRIVVRKSKSGDNYQGMDFDYMKAYIKKHDNAEKNLAILDNSIAEKISYVKIRKWFLDEYPELKAKKSSMNLIVALNDKEVSNNEKCA